MTWGEFDRATQEHGLATTGGRVSTTGVAGFTLGGGSGWAERKYGLASTTSSRLTWSRPTAADHREPDRAPELFWALHGGGGNFGVATAFEFQLTRSGRRYWPGCSPGRADQRPVR